MEVHNISDGSIIQIEVALSTTDGFTYLKKGNIFPNSANKIYNELLFRCSHQQRSVVLRVGLWLSILPNFCKLVYTAHAVRMLVGLLPQMILPTLRHQGPVV